MTEFTPLHNSSFSGIEGGDPDEAVEDTYFRLIIESPLFKQLEPDEQEIFLITLAQNCLQWVMERKDY
jgi:hypothetical protein